MSLSSGGVFLFPTLGCLHRHNFAAKVRRQEPTMAAICAAPANVIAPHDYLVGDFICTPYAGEMRDALERWAEHVEAITR